MTIPADQIALLRERSLPFCADGDMVFRSPWEAKAFAIVVTMSQAGHFSWTEWVDCFAEQVAAATKDEAEGRSPKTYYQQWLDALELLLTAKGMTSSEQLMAKRLGALQGAGAHVTSVPKTSSLK